MKTIADLIDELSIVNIKIFHLVEVMEGEDNDTIVAEAARKVQKLNRQRSQLINEINERFGWSTMNVKM